MGRKKGRSVNGGLYRQAASCRLYDVVNKCAVFSTRAKRAMPVRLTRLLPAFCPSLSARTLAPFRILWKRRNAISSRWNLARSRTTDDKEGEVLETSGPRPDDAAFRAVLPRFIGEIMQIRPFTRPLAWGCPLPMSSP